MINEKEKRGSRFSIFLEVAEPVKKDDGWDVFAAATVFFEKRYAPRPPQEVVFVANENETDRILTDDESGRVSSTLIFPAEGGYLLTVFLASEPAVRVTRRISIRSDKKPKISSPASVSVTVSGPRGEQKLSIAVVSAEGNFISGFSGRIMDGDTFSPFVTEADGICVYKIKDFQEGEKNRAIEIRVGNKPEQIWNGVLLGHKALLQQKPQFSTA